MLSNKKWISTRGLLWLLNRLKWSKVAWQLSWNRRTELISTTSIRSRKIWLCNLSSSWEWSKKLLRKVSSELTPFENHIGKLKKPTSSSKLTWTRTRLYTRRRYRIWSKNEDSLRGSTSPRPRLKTKPSRSSTPEVPLKHTGSTTK